MNITKHFFTVWVMEHLHRLPRDVIEFPSLATFRRCLDVVLCTWLYVMLLDWGRGAELDPSNPKRSVIMNLATQLGVSAQA